MKLERSDVTAPMQVIKVRGKGMPLRGADPPRNGTLHVRALVEFPSTSPGRLSGSPSRYLTDA